MVYLLRFYTMNSSGKIYLAKEIGTSKIGRIASEVEVTLQLVKSKCIPI